MANGFYSDSPLVLQLNEPCGRAYCGPGWERTRENSLNLRDWELWLVWRGRGWMRTNSGSHPLFAGFCALMRPGGIYDAGHDDADPLGITFIHFDIERGRAQGDSSVGNLSDRREAALGKRAVSPIAVDASVRRVVASQQGPLRIDSEPASWPEFFLLDDIEYADLLTSRIIGLLDENLPAAAGLLHAFLMDLLEREPIAQEAWEGEGAGRSILGGDKTAEVKKPKGKALAGQVRATAGAHRKLPHYRELRQLFARLRTTSPEALPSVAQMATQAGLSPEHFSRLFRRVNGQSPMQFIVALRITHARHLLRESSLSVGEIADRLGYGDVYFFSRQFKEQTGISPLAYRKQG